VTEFVVDGRPGHLALVLRQGLRAVVALLTDQARRHRACRFGDHDVPVPEPLGVILTELIRTGHTHAASRLGIYAMAGRRVALTDLAAQLPAAGRAHHRWRFHGDLRNTRDPTGQRGSGRSRGRAARRPPEIRAADNAHSTASTMEQPSTARKLPT